MEFADRYLHLLHFFVKCLNLQRITCICTQARNTVKKASADISDLGNVVQGRVPEFVDNVKLGSVANCEEDRVNLQKGHRQVARMNGKEAGGI